ncbi:MAG: galactokinase family protein, partial [Verrucomicrobiota bacterium]|nr:galactokinase family protein [Verrucomicrobiota bacterium]
MKKEDYKMAFVEDTKDWCFSFAPGRIEFLGNHLDYNGGDVLGMAVNAGIYCLGVPDSENKPDGNTKSKNRFSLFSENFEDAVWEGQLDNIERQDGKFAWTNYCLGVLKELQERDLAPSEGFRLIFTSNLPTSVGLSSSAALELASALTILQLAEKSLPTKELASLCRSAENQFVGLPCGILDQGTSAFGKKDHLVHIDC